VLGCGRIASNHVDAIQKHADRCELVAVCDTDPAALAAMVARTGARGYATLGAMLAGYLVGFATIPRFVSQQRYLAFSALLGIVLTLGAFLTSGYVSVGCVAALGFANAMMWPAIFPLANSWTGTLDRARIGIADHGYRRRRAHSAGLCAASPIA